jgi:hypothetical protein
MNRLTQINAQFGPTAAASDSGKKDSLSVTDNRTGKQYELKITDGAINCTDLGKIKD